MSEVRYYRDRDRDRDDDSSDNDRHRTTTTTTVRRYKVAPSRNDRNDRFLEVDDDRRSRHSSHLPERPRSAFEPYGDRSRITVYEHKDGERDWDRRSRNDRHDDDIRVEKRYNELYEDHGYDVERYRKETEYYTQADPPPAPVIIRQRVPDPQKIIVQEAPPPAPIIVPRQDPGVVVLRDRDSRRQVARREPSEEEYYYRHERRDLDRYRGHGDDRDWGVVGRPRHGHRRHHEPEHYSDDDDYYMRRTVVRRERSQSRDHFRRIAEGALAGGGITALMQSRPGHDGELPEHRGRKVIAGAALGAIGSEALNRAHSAYGDRWGDDESPDHHSKLKTGLGIAAVALAAAGAAKYYKSGKIEKEESRRGRSRHKHYSGSRSGSHSVSRSRSKRGRSMSTAAKAALGTAATAGIIKHFRSKSRHGSRSRSKSKLRTGAEIAGAAAAAGLATKAWKSHKDKKERARSANSDYHSQRGSRSRSRSMSRSRSRSRPAAARSFHSDDGADPELGLVEYGGAPLSPYESEAEERRRRRRSRARSASRSDRGESRRRSKSRLRNAAAAAAGAGAGAFGIKEYKDRKDQEKRERRRSEERRRSRERHDDRRQGEADDYYDGRPSSPPMASGGAYYPPYPATPGPGAAVPPFDAAGNAYPQYAPQDYTGYPPPPPPAGPPPAAAGPPPPGPGPAGGYPPPQPPPGPPPAGNNHPPDHVSDQSHQRPRSAGDKRKRDDDGVTAQRQSGEPRRTARREKSPPPAPSKSVSFIPLSPMSSRTMERHRMEHEAHEDGDASSHAPDEQVGYFDDARGAVTQLESHGSSHHRRSSDPLPDGLAHRHGRRSRGVDSDDESEIEVLPDRFDAHGQPLGQHTTSHQHHKHSTSTTSRSGEFQRRPQRPGDWDVRGAWAVSGVDGEAVERLARNVTGVLEGRGSWMGLLGEVLGGGMVGQGGKHGERNGRGVEDGEEDDHDEQRRRRRRTKGKDK